MMRTTLDALNPARFDWHTRDERMFLAAAVGAKLFSERRAFLESYLQGCELRLARGDMDRHQVVAFAHDLLNALPKVAA